MLCFFVVAIHKTYSIFLFESLNIDPWLVIEGIYEVCVFYYHHPSTITVVSNEKEERVLESIVASVCKTIVVGRSVV